FFRDIFNDEKKYSVLLESNQMDSNFIPSPSCVTAAITTLPMEISTPKSSGPSKPPLFTKPAKRYYCTDPGRQSEPYRVLAESAKDKSEKRKPPLKSKALRYQYLSAP
ncbi:MAG: hypothetical protein JRJ71_13560, partial [Deltaproteobacteria bacterium]|nr:hypothetical protein [Deltaproteobacteria bacterium]